MRNPDSQRTPTISRLRNESKIIKLADLLNKGDKIYENNMNEVAKIKKRKAFDDKFNQSEIVSNFSLSVRDE